MEHGHGQPAVGEKNAQAPSRAAQQAGRGADRRGAAAAKLSASPEGATSGQSLLIDTNSCKHVTSLLNV